MSLNARDKKIIMVLVPLLLIGAFTFLVIKPKRQEAVKATQAAITSQRRRRTKWARPASMCRGFYTTAR